MKFAILAFFYCVEFMKNSNSALFSLTDFWNQPLFFTMFISFNFQLIKMLPFFKLLFIIFYPALI